MEDLLTTLLWIAIGLGVFVFRHVSEARKRKSEEENPSLEEGDFHPFEPIYDEHPSEEDELLPVESEETPLPTQAFSPSSPVSSVRRARERSTSSPDSTASDATFEGMTRPKPDTSVLVGGLSPRQAFLAAEILGKPKSLR
jgi:hypothetical protein